MKVYGNDSYKRECKTFLELLDVDDVVVRLHTGFDSVDDGDAYKIFAYAHMHVVDYTSYHGIGSALERYPSATVETFAGDIDLDGNNRDINYPSAGLVDPVFWKYDDKIAAVTVDGEMYLPDFFHHEDSRGKNCNAYADFVNMIIGGGDERWAERLASELGGLAEKHERVTIVRADVEMDVDGFVEDATRSATKAKEMIEARWGRKIEALKQEIERVKSVSIVETLKLVNTVRNAGFVFEDWNKLKYTGGKIKTSRVMDKGKVYTVDEEMYVERLRVKLRSDGKIYSASCWRSSHPNARGKYICIGAMRGEDVTDIGELVDALMLPNLDSCYNPSHWENVLDETGEEVEDTTVWSSSTATERVIDGIEEHRHEGHDYWHPVSRVHSEAA